MAKKAALKTQPTNASVADFIAGVSDPQRRADCAALVDMLSQATGVAPRLWGTAIVGFGAYRYVYASGRSGEWPVIGFSPRKNDLSLYIMPGFDAYAGLLGRLGRHRTGKSCLYLKRLADVDPKVLRELVNASVQAMKSRRVDL